MTYCYAFKYGSSVFLFADSAVTTAQQGSEPSQTSSFGESARLTKSGYVREGLQKIMVIGEDCVIAYSGDVHRATEAGGLFKSFYRADISVEEVIRSVAAVCDQTSPEIFEFLIARQGLKGPELWRWRSDESMPSWVEHEVSTGSLRSWHSGFSKYLSGVLGRGGLEEHRMLVAISATIQGFGIHDPLFDQGVGGVLCSARLTPYRVEWLPDTNFFVGFSDLKAGNLITLLHRGHATVVSSSFYEASQGVSVLLNTVSHPDLSAWEAQWASAAMRQISAAAARYWIFLSADWLNILIVEADDVVPEVSVCGVRRPEPGKYLLSFHDERGGTHAAPSTVVG